MAKILFSILLVAVFATGCEPNVKPDATANAQQQATAGQSGETEAGAQVGGLNEAGGNGGTALAGQDQTVSYAKAAINDPNSVLAERVIYFDFDSDQIGQNYLDLLEHHGKYLAANPDVKLRIEGHADERGTREYNVALGNRRAQAVKRLILFQGADPKQIQVISYGEEKPVALDHDEAAWRLNRRVELVYILN